MKDRLISTDLWVSRVGWRVTLVTVGICLLCCLVALRAVQLVVQPPDRVAQLAKRAAPVCCSGQQPPPVPLRGSFYDRNDQLLAISLPVHTLALDKRRFDDVPANWDALHAAVGLDTGQAHRRYSTTNANWVYLRRHLTNAQAEGLKKAAITGVVLVPEAQRYYPAGEILAPIVGLTDIDGRGLEGLELTFNSLLKVGAQQRLSLPGLTDRRQEAPPSAAENGRDLHLTLDIYLQYLAYRSLKQAVLSSQAKGGSITVVDVPSGEILALASYPSYNPNNRRSLQVQRNRAAMDRLEPGSLFKPFTVIAALQTGQWQADSLIDTAPGYLQLSSGEQFADLRNHGQVTVNDILAVSSQVGAVRLGLSLQPAKHIELLRRLGFGQITGVGLPAEAEGWLPPVQTMTQVHQATLSFGHGCAVTALQLAQAYSVLGNGGIRVPLKLIQGASVADKARVISAAAAQQVVAALEQAVHRGTGHRAALAGYRVAGKTGTSHLTGRQGYASDRYRAMFAGLVPANRPRLAIVVAVDEPGEDRYYGGQVAAPLFAKVARQSLLRLGIAPRYSHLSAGSG